MHEPKDITAQIEITKNTQGYSLGKPNEREIPNKTLCFIQTIFSRYITLEIGFYVGQFESFMVCMVYLCLMFVIDVNCGL
jgi:hypothetical protein